MIDSLIKDLINAPVANLLIVAGVLFLGLGIVGKVSGKLEPDRNGRIASSAAGIVLILAGVLVIRNDTSSPEVTTAAKPAVVAVGTTAPPMATVTSLPTGTAVPTSAPSPTLSPTLAPVITIPPLSPTPALALRQLHRDSELDLLANGDVQENDTWELQFLGGPYSQFTRRFVMSGGNPATDWAITENGQTYKENNTGTSHTFNVTRTGDTYDIVWFFDPVTNQARTFGFHFVAHNVVGRAGIGRSLRWRPVSGHEYPIDAAHVLVKLPKSYDLGAIKASATLNGNPTTGVRVVDGQTIDYIAPPITRLNDEWLITVDYPG